jgi:hypothetical protein
MVHNLAIDIASNSTLVIVWTEGKAVGSYWVCMGTYPTDGIPFLFLDGPFPNQWMAAADFYKRASVLKGWHSAVPGQTTDDVVGQFGAEFGINFKAAFKAAQPPFPDLEGVFYSSFDL